MTHLTAMIAAHALARDRRLADRPARGNKALGTVAIYADGATRHLPPATCAGAPTATISR